MAVARTPCASMVPYSSSRRPDRVRSTHGRKTIGWQKASVKLSIAKKGARSHDRPCTSAHMMAIRRRIISCRRWLFCIPYWNLAYEQDLSEDSEQCQNKTASIVIWTMKDTTWLILPVVICLSQRLSHACVSMTVWYGSCEWLIISAITYTMIILSWITVVILELIHAYVPMGVLIVLKPFLLDFVLMDNESQIAHVATYCMGFCPISFGW